MQPYQPDYHQQQAMTHEQDYQTIPEDQYHPVFFRGRRNSPEVIVIPFYPYPYPYLYPYPYYPYPFPYSGFGGVGGFGGY